MKKLLLLASLFIFLSCDDKEAASDNSDAFLSRMAGRYTLTQIYTDTAIDLDFDGVPHTDMALEMDCQVFHPLQWYSADVDYNPNHERYFDLMFQISNSDVTSETVPMEQCFFGDILLYNDSEINTDTGEITINEHSAPDREVEYGTLTHARYQDRVLYLEVDKIMFTAEGWQHIPMHFVYEWHNP
jgi:hypothetical protein